MADEAPVAATAGDESKQAHPDSMAEITTEWLTTVLAGHVGRKVTSFDCHAVGQGDEIAGFASDTARVTAVLEPLAEGAAAKFAGDTVDLYAKFRYTTDDEKRPGTARRANVCVCVCARARWAAQRVLTGLCTRPLQPRWPPLPARWRSTTTSATTCTP